MKLRTLFFLLGLTSAALAATPQTASPRATDQVRQLDPATELAAAKKELAEMRMRYRDKHPAIVMQLQEIKRLEKAVATATTQVTSPAATEQSRQINSAAELAAARQDLAEMRKRFRDKHPAVVTQLQKIKQLEKSVGATQAEPAAATK